MRGETITDDEIEFAAKQAFAHDFIRERNKGYNSVVKSDTLSGGQKQRIASMCLPVDPATPLPAHLL